MKVSSAKLSFYRQSSRKVRDMADVIRGMSVVNAEAQLSHTPRRAGVVILKLMRSAVANAIDLNKTLDKKDLFVEEVRVDEGPTLKRYRPRAMGRASRINKRTSHITIGIGAKKSLQQVQGKQQDIAEEKKKEAKKPAKKTEKKSVRQAQDKSTAKKATKKSETTTKTTKK